MEMMQLELAHQSAYCGDGTFRRQSQLNAGRLRAKPRVLVVDEDEDTSDTLAMLFELFGCEVQATCDWKDVEKIATVFHPDLMIVDLGHPQSCVLDTIRCIRVAAGAKTVRVIAQSAWTHEKARTWASEVGCDDYLLKPVEASVLRRLLENLPLAELDVRPAFTTYPLTALVPA